MLLGACLDNLGQCFVLFPRGEYLLVQVLCAGKDLATEKSASRMTSLMRQMQQSLPPSTLASTWSYLQPQHQLALQSILS